MLFCIGLAVVKFSRENKSGESPSLFLPFFLPSPFLDFFLSFSLYQVHFFLSFYLLIFFPFLFSLALEKPQNSSYRNWGSIVSFPSKVWGRSIAESEFSALRIVLK